MTHSPAEPGCLQRRELAGCIFCGIVKKRILPLAHVQSLAQAMEQPCSSGHRKETGSFPFYTHPFHPGSEGMVAGVGRKDWESSLPIQ